METASQSCPRPQGILMIIGGKEGKSNNPPEHHKLPDGYDPMEVLKIFVKLINKKGDVEVITTGSEDGQDLFAEYKKVFNDLGLQLVNHVHHKERHDVLNDQTLKEKAQKSVAFFIAGGDQLTLTSMYGGTEFLRDLKERYIRDKIIIAGTSAGAMALSTPMIYAGSKEVEQLGKTIKVTTGLEFLKDVCVDTHFVHRGRFVRMAQVLATNPTCIGVGLDEDTAMVIKNGTETEIIGSGIIIIMEGFNMAYTNIDRDGENTPVSMRDLRIHLLSRGDKYSIPQLNPPHL